MSLEALTDLLAELCNAVEQRASVEAALRACNGAAPWRAIEAERLRLCIVVRERRDAVLAHVGRVSR